MKNLILDELIPDSFSDYLEKGETIVWQASADKKEYSIAPTKPEREKVTVKNFSLDILFLIFFFVSFYFIENLSNGEFYLLAFSLMFLFILIERIRSKPIKYAITTHRVLFKSIISRKVRMYEIPLSEINQCIIVENNNQKGTIFLAIKNPDTIDFDTLRNGEKRHQPTLENIENPEAVAELIREGIKNVNTLL